MNCKKIEKLIITDYIDGQISEKLKNKVKAHIYACPQCKQFEQDLLNTTVEPFKNAGSLQPPEYLWHRIKDAVIAQEKSGARQSLPVFGRLMDIFSVKKPAFAFAAVAVLIIVAVIFFRGPSRQAVVNSYIDEQAGFLSELDMDDEIANLGTKIEERFF